MKWTRHCLNCKWKYYLHRQFFCILAKERITDPYEENVCDFWRPDIDDILHDNDAMEWGIKKNNQNISGKE